MGTILYIGGALVTSAPVCAQTGVVDGVVFDSLQSRPLAGALVQLIESPSGHGAYAATADSLGRFRVDSVPAGQYIMGFLHPVLDSLGVTAPYRAVTVDENATVHARLAISSAARLTSAICAPAHTGHAAASPDGTGTLVGHVRDAVNGAFVAGSLVAVVWSALVVDARGVRRETQQMHGSTNGDGWFAICGLEAGDYEVRAELGTRATGFLDVAVRAHDIARTSFLLGADSDSVAASDSTPRAGGATLAGVVTTAGGHPLEGAHVVVEGSSVSAITDACGAFVLTGLPDGTRMAEARTLGYAPARVPVEPSRNESRPVAIEMDTRVTTLDAITVYGKADARLRDLSGFVERQRRGFGRFLTRSDIDRSNATSVCDLLRRVAGWSVFEGGIDDCQVTMRGSRSRMGASAGSGACEPTLYMDNVPFGGSVGEFARTVSPAEIVGIELYSTATEPPQFMGECGSIVVWTR